MTDFKLGILRQTGGGRYDFHSGGEVEVDIVNKANAPTNELINARIERGVLVKFYTDVPAASQPAWSTPRKHVVLMHMHRSADQITVDDHVQGHLMALNVKRILKATGKDVWDVEVRSAQIVDPTGYWTLLQHPYMQPYIQDQIAEQLPGFDPNFYVSNKSPLPAGIVGLAYIGSFFCVTGAGARNPHTIVHELYHCFGGPHSTHWGNEYGDPTCRLAMAYSGVNACKSLTFGLVPDDRVLTITGTTRVRLVPTEVCERTLAPNEYQILRVVTPDAVWIVAPRTSHLQKLEGTYAAPGELHITCFESMNFDGGKSDFIGAVSEGQTQEIAFDRTNWTDQPYLTLFQVEEDVYEVVVDYNDGITASPLSGPLVSPITPNRVQRSIRADIQGLWHDPAYELQGFGLYLGDTSKDQPEFYGFWFAHEAQGYRERTPISPEDKGRAWFDLEGRFTDNDSLLEVQIAQSNEDGTRTINRGVFYAIDDERVGFQFYTEAYGRDYQELEKFEEPTPDSLNGLYSSTELEATGLMLGRYGDRYVGHWYERADSNWAILDGQLENMLTMRPRSRFKSFKGEIVNDVNEQGFSQVEPDVSAVTIEGKRYPLIRTS